MPRLGGLAGAAEEGLTARGGLGQIGGGGSLQFYNSETFIEVSELLQKCIQTGRMVTRELRAWWTQGRPGLAVYHGCVLGGGPCADPQQRRGHSWGQDCPATRPRPHQPGEDRAGLKDGAPG